MLFILLLPYNLSSIKICLTYEQTEIEGESGAYILYNYVQHRYNKPIFHSVSIFMFSIPFSNKNLMHEIKQPMYFYILWQMVLLGQKIKILTHQFSQIVSPYQEYLHNIDSTHHNYYIPPGIIKQYFLLIIMQLSQSFLVFLPNDSSVYTKTITKQ